MHRAIPRIAAFTLAVGCGLPAFLLPLSGFLLTLPFLAVLALSLAEITPRRVALGARFVATALCLFSLRPPHRPHLRTSHPHPLSHPAGPRLQVPPPSPIHPHRRPLALRARPHRLYPIPLHRHRPLRLDLRHVPLRKRTRMAPRPLPRMAWIHRPSKYIRF